jgi:hypothetical protein
MAGPAVCGVRSNASRRLDAPAHLDERKLEYTKVHFKRIALQMTMEFTYIGVKRTTSEINFERPDLKCPAPGANQAPCVSSGQQV